MRTIVVLLGLVGCVVLGCDALEPEWGERWRVGPADPHPDVTCDDLCEAKGRLCMESSCDAPEFGDFTIALYTDPFAPDASQWSDIACDESLTDWGQGWAGPGQPWSMTVSCCCSAGAE